MNMKPNTTKMLSVRREQSKECVNKVIQIITEMKEKQIALSKAEICRRAGVSSNYFTRHTELYKLYDDAVGKKSHKKMDTQDKDSSAIVILSLRTENKKLKQELEKARTALKLALDYKDKCAELEQKNKELNERLNDYLSQSLI